ncbi:AAA family ATPase [Trinickia sp. LjRoot230]|uniref:AAA family ATPase n=1 Tax=Trinickia sp. LjRoot230 TaxID=3342288 RepID=UPI003ECF7067
MKQLSAISNATPSNDFATVLAEGFARRIGMLAEQLGANSTCVSWARRAAFAASRATNAGHVCVPIARLAHRYGAEPTSVRRALAASGVVSDGSEHAAALRPLVVDTAGRLYLARYFDYERRLAAAIVAHASHASVGVGADVGIDETALDARLMRYFGPPPADAIDWQRAAAALALAGRLTIVSGGPGTGKTTTVVGMLACLVDADPTLSIALAAPTGKAAQRMQEALAARAAALPPDIAARLPTRALTLHRLLGAGQGGRMRYHRDNPLPFDVLVIDEASMIDVAMAAQLFDALAPETRLVMLGDKDQLAAVEAGAVFAELSAVPAFSARGIARIARAAGVSDAQVASALPDASTRGTLMPGDGALFDTPFDDDAFLSSATEIEREWTMQEDASLSASLATAPVLESMTAEQPIEERDAVHAAALVDCVVWLERNYRFGLESPIGRLSLAIRGADIDAALAALTVTHDEAADYAATTAGAWLDEDIGPALGARTVERLAQGFAHYGALLEAALMQPLPDPQPLFEALNAYRILCATRVGARGADTLNGLMAAHVRHAAHVPLAPGATWFPGRPVMIARNDYALGLFNGDVGIALPGAGGALRVYFRTAEGGVRAVAPAALPPHDTAFALTVHKSQGSEFDAAALVLPASASRVMSRELVYTAVTRARAAVRIVGARAVLADAISAPTRRDSGLAARMQAAFAAARDG